MILQVFQYLLEPSWTWNIFGTSSCFFFSTELQEPWLVVCKITGAAQTVWHLCNCNAQQLSKQGEGWNRFWNHLHAQAFTAACCERQVSRNIDKIHSSNISNIPFCILVTLTMKMHFINCSSMSFHCGPSKFGEFSYVLRWVLITKY